MSKKTAKIKQPSKREREMIDKNLDLIFEFEKYVLAHPEFADDIPDDALVIMQIEGDTEFNQWTRRLAHAQVEEGQPIVYITIKKLGTPRSRIEELELERVA